MYIYTHTYTYLSLYIYIYKIERERERATLITHVYLRASAGRATPEQRIAINYDYAL